MGLIALFLPFLIFIAIFHQIKYFVDPPKGSGRGTTGMGHDHEWEGDDEFVSCWICRETRRVEDIHKKC